MESQLTSELETKQVLEQEHSRLQDQVSLLQRKIAKEEHLEREAVVARDSLTQHLVTLKDEIDKEGREIRKLEEFNKNCQATIEDLSKQLVVQQDKTAQVVKVRMRSIGDYGDLYWRFYRTIVAHDLDRGLQWCDRISNTNLFNKITSCTYFFEGTF
jgi:hypothetical protein